jgi:mannosidase alpha-like ER degradation enhancer 2
LRPYFGALDAFMPAVLALAGDIERAEKLQASCFAMWNLHGIEPELIDFEKMSVAEGAEAYHLRPEIIESAYYLYHFTGDPVYVEMVLTTEAHPLRKTW